jgi:hypothetical protein
MVVIEELGRIAEAMPDYDVERELGRGGMGVVFLGRHKRLERGVAIKELPPSFASEPLVRDRFSTEARTLATLSHPHIVPIFDYVEREGLCLIVMEQLPGGTVWDRFTTTGLTPPAACAIVMACCAALHHAHSKGVLHLDVKPDNLMFDAESAVKVTDFGIARVISGDRTMGTVDGQVLGTPAYMSPEQARGEDLTPASDVYAAGVMLYELLSGQLPWQGAETAAELLSQRLREDPIPLRDLAPHVPQPIADVVMHALAREVADRFERAEDLGIAIGEACAESWGVEWLDHAGIALVGSDRLSRAARTTTSHLPRATPAPAAPTAGPTAPPAGTARASETGAVAPSGTGPPRAAETGVVGPAGTGAPRAAETGVVGRADPDAPRAAETGVVGRADPAAPRAAETGVVGRAPAAPDQARETTARDASTPAPAPERARETTTGDRPAAPAPAPATGGVAPVAPEVDGPAAPDAPPSPKAPPEFQVVKAASAEPRIQGADIYLLQLADLVGVEDVLDPPKPPWPALLVTGLLAAAALLVGLIGLGEPSRDAGLDQGQVELAGVDVATGDRVELDLAEDVPVGIIDPSLAATVDAVELELSYLGLPVSSATAPVRGGQAALDPGIAQRTIAGKATATLRLETGTQVVAEHDFAVDATQTWYLTLPFVAAVLLLLLAYANLESSLKPLRSGHPRVLSYVGAFFSGAIAGVGLVLLSGALGLAEPTVLGAAVTTALGALAGVAAARARIGVARRRRVRRALKRAERSLGVKATTKMKKADEAPVEAGADR